MHRKLLSENFTERDHSESIVLDRRIILKSFLGKQRVRIAIGLDTLVQWDSGGNL
jgi:hypothetical protein